ncbi:MAG: hypothetical protein K8Q99_06850 [Acholeplasmataceae bacterium]|nr:hypothetical protein [Acholeplasmataceae bacterium]
MKLKDVENNYTKFNAYLVNEGKNESTYYDHVEYKLIKGKITTLVNDPEDFPEELKDCNIIGFDVEIVLGQRGVTSWGNTYRKQRKTISLLLE